MTHALAEEAHDQLMTDRTGPNTAAIQARNQLPEVQLIVINQTVGPAFLDWMVRLAAASGPIELWSGNAPDTLGTRITVRHFAPYNNSQVTSRLVTWGRFTLGATWQLLRQGGRTPLFVVTNPPFMPLTARWLRLLQKRRYGLLEWDIYPQVLATMGLVQPKNLLYRLWRCSHAGSLRHADLIVTLGDHMATVLRRTADDAALPVMVAPNWVNTDWLTPLSHEDNPFIQEQGLQDKLVVLYSGNLGATHAVETIVEVARLLADDAQICFLIIGEGSKARPGRIGHCRGTHADPAPPASSACHAPASDLEQWPHRHRDPWQGL